MPAAKKSAIHEAARELGRYIVADPKICHGKPTFRGTRILVDSVLEMVAGGMPWDRIVWDGMARSSPRQSPKRCP
jgi:hypothetical protein